jgi:formylglycine-generating enzyme required for sulfatase activity
VKPFSIGRTEVTQAQWQAVMGNNPSGFKEETRPVESITWYQAKEFCEKLSERSGYQVRLPTEAEWEYAARGGTTTEYSFGEDETKLGEYAWFRGNAGDQTHPVGQKKPNPFGLYDMHGNVWEWVEDYWHNNYVGAPRDGSAWLVGGDSALRVLRGGSWNLSFNLRSAIRLNFFPVSRVSNNGFRVVVGAQTQSGK